VFSSVVLIAVVTAVFMTGAAAGGGSAGRSPGDGGITGAGVVADRRPTSAYSRQKGVWARPSGRHVPLGRLTIPSLDVRTKFRLGVHDRIVRLGPGLWPGTPFPGVQGNSVLAGHRTSYTRPFADLDLLEPGDVIRTRAPGGQVTAFRVFQVAIVPEVSYREFVLRQPRRPAAREITLFACTPKGMRTHRIVVRARVQGGGEAASGSHQSGSSADTGGSSTGRMDIV
jgi:LPXTG-site transpeptidase (sortase) family protein